MKKQFRTVISAILTVTLALAFLVTPISFTKTANAASNDYELRWKPGTDATINSYFESVNFDDQSNHNLVNPQNVSTSYDSTIKQGVSGYSLKATSQGGANIQFKGKAAFNAGPNNADNYMISYDFYLSKLPETDNISNTIIFYDENMTSSQTKGGMQVENGSGTICVAGDPTSYSLSAEEWHNFTVVISKKTGVYHYFYDKNLVYEGNLGYAAHIYDIGLYFPKEDGLSVYIDNAQIAMVEWIGEELGGDDNTGDDNTGDDNTGDDNTNEDNSGNGTNDYDKRWKPGTDATINSYFETVNFDDQSNHNLVNPQNVSTSYDSTIKQGASGYSLKATSQGGANIQFKGKAAFNAGPNNADNYRISYDFYLSKLPETDKISNTIIFYDENMTSSQTKGGMQVENGSGTICVAGDPTDYSLNAEEWHNFTVVISKKTGVYHYFYDNNLVYEGNLGYAAHIYDIGLYFPKEDGLSVYIDNAQIAMVEWIGEDLGGDDNMEDDNTGDITNDFETTWTQKDLVDSVNFDTTSSVVGQYYGNNGFVYRHVGSWVLDDLIKKGNSGKSVKASGTASQAADIRFYLTNAFKNSGKSATAYKFSYDFNLAALPTADIVRNTLIFTKNNSTSNTLAGIQIANDGSGDVLVNGVATDYSISAGDWHNIAYVYDTTTHIYECYFDGALVHKDVISSTNPDTFHEMQLSFKGHDMYIDNIEVATLKPYSAEDDDSGEDSGENGDSASDSNWMEADVVDEANFDNTTSVASQYHGETGFAYRHIGSWALDESVKKGDSGKSVKASGTTSSAADIRFYLSTAFSGTGKSGDAYKLSYDFNLPELPKADLIRNSLVFVKNNKISNTLGAIQIANDGTGNVLVNGTPTGKKVTVNKWYNISYVFDSKTCVYECYFDNALVHKDVISSTHPDSFHEMDMSFKGHDVYLDNIRVVLLDSNTVEIKSAEAKGYTTKLFMSSKIADAADGKPVDFSSLVTLWKDNTQLDVSSVKYDADYNCFILTTPSPVVSSATYVAKLDSSIANKQGVNVESDYEFEFSAVSADFGVANIAVSANGTVTAKLVNTSGSDKTAVMIIVGKDATGTVTSMTTSPVATVGASGATLSAKPVDSKATDFDIFFINNWENRVAIKRSILEYEIVPGSKPVFSASYDSNLDAIKINGQFGKSKDMDVVVSIAQEAEVTSAGSVLEKPFTDDNKPLYALRCTTGENGKISESLSFDTLSSGIYYVYASSEAGSAYVRVAVVEADSEETKAVIKKCNDENSQSVLSDYLKENLVTLGIDTEYAREYSSAIAKRVIADRPEGGYDLDKLSDTIDYAIATAKIASGISVDDVMNEYASVFGCEYGDYAALSAKDRQAFDNLIKALAPGIDRLTFDNLALIAKVRAASDTWGNLKECMTANAEDIGIDISDTSKYMKIASGNRYEVFANIKSKTAFATIKKEIVDAFDEAVDNVYKKYKNENSGSSGSNGSSGFSGSSVVVGTDKIGVEPSTALSYTDIDNHFAKDSVEFLSTKNIINGYPDKTFRPNSSVTRAEFAAMIVRAFDITGAEGNGFADVKSADWFYNDVISLSSKGIILGDNGNFRPNDNITRQDAAVIIERALKSVGKSYSGNANFDDAKDVSEYALEAVGAMAKAGVIVGSDNCFYPSNNITRGESAVMLFRAFNIRMEA